MWMSNQNQLEEKMKQLEKEVDALKHRIHQLESRIYGGNEQGIQQAVKSNIKSDKAVIDRVPKKSRTDPRERRNEDQASIDWEKLLLQVWMPRLFIFVLIVGVLWGFKAASDYGFINEPVKIALGFMASAFLLYVGRKQMKQDRKKFGYVLLGGAVPLLMLTTFAMHSLYGMAGPAAAFVLNVLWIMLGLFLTKTYQSEALAIISMVGGVLVPFLIESETPNPYVFLGYETLLYVLFLSLAVRFDYRKIYYGASILLNIALFIFYSFTGGLIQGYVVAVPIIIQYGLILYYFVKTNKQVSAQANTLLASLFITYVWVNGTFTDGFITLFLLAFILAYAALSYKWKSDSEKVPMFHIHVIVLTAFLIIHAIDEQFTTSLLLVQGAAAYYSAFKYPSMLKKVISLFIYAAAGVTVLGEGVIYDAFSMETLDWLVLLVTFAAGAKLIYKHGKINRDFFVTVSSAVFALLFLIFTTQFTLACIDHMSDDSQRLILTFVWLMLSLSSIGAGVIKENKQAKYIGVALLILTLLKLVLLDIPYIPLFIRAILFIALGFAGLMVSRIFYKNK